MRINAAQIGLQLKVVMRNGLKILLLVCCTLFQNARADELNLMIEDAWVRGTVPAQQVTGVFLKLISSKNSILLGAHTAIAKEVQIHEMSMNDGIMQMRQLPRLALAAGRKVELSPGGIHLMLVGLKRPLETGAQIPITLVLQEEGERPQEIEFMATVRPLTAGVE